MPGEVPPPIPPQENLPLQPVPPREKPVPKPKDKPRDKPGAKPTEPDDGEPRLPRREEPATEAQEEAERLIRRGREEFAVGEYGRAAQRFRRASELTPRDTTLPFLLAQCLLAMAKYTEASETLIAALKARPDWPTTAFRPLDLHNAAGDYAETIEALEATRKRHPDEPLLQFLAGYMRWLDGRREEARDLFRQARAADFAPQAIETFLKTLPDAAPF
jgi:tetratricopeptide (TPR) repeat protein